MCTLTYLPKADSGYFLTSNRDENINRNRVNDPGVYSHGLVKVLYPKDATAGGTWLAVADNGYALCLLNGAFTKHVSEPPYLRSRGLVLLDFFDFNDPKVFAQMYNFKGIEPFTLVAISDGKGITELRWDGENIYQMELDPSKSQIWSSVTLYNEELRLKREELFRTFLMNHDEINVEDLLQFHHFGGEGVVQPSIKLSLNANGVQTISVSCIESKDEQFSFYHEDVLLQKTVLSDLGKSNLKRQ
jgi:hypothetical protein